MQRKRGSWTAPTTWLLALLVLMGACGQPTTEAPVTTAATVTTGVPATGEPATTEAPGEEFADVPTLSIINPSGVSMTPYYYAVDQDLFAEAGLSIEPIMRTSGSEVIEIFTAGEADIAMTGPGPMGVTIGKGVPAKATNFFSYGMVVIAAFDPEIQAIEDLGGKVYAVSGIGSASEVIGRMALFAKGFDTHEQTTIQPMTAPEMVTAARLGQIEAASTWPPFYQFMEQEVEGTHILLNVVEEWPELYGTQNPPPFHGILVKNEVLENHPQAVLKIQEIIAQSVEAIQDDPGEQARLLEEYEGMEPEIAQAAVESGLVTFNSSPTLTDDDAQNALQILQFMFEHEYMDFEPTMEEVFWQPSS